MMLRRLTVFWPTVAAIVAFSVVLPAQEDRAVEEQETAIVAVEEFGDAQRVFVAALGAARSNRARDVADAQARYDRTVATLEAASAALTADARKSIEEGPLADARQAHHDALKAAERRFEGAVTEAVEAYGGPAVMVFSAALEATAAVRMEYELYAAVIGAAEAALASEMENSRAARTGGQGAEAGFKAAEASLAEARRAYNAGVLDRNAVRRTEPAEPEPDYAGNFLGGLAAGLSEAVGDYEGASTIRGQLDREASARQSNHATSVDQFTSRLADAEEAMKAAGDVLNAATRRFNAASARIRSTREAGSSADSAYYAAYQARTAAGIDAARLTRVHSIDELEAVTESVRDWALSAIEEISRPTLASLTQPMAARALEAAVAEYAQPRTAAIEAALDEIEADYRNSLESADRRYNEALADASSVVDKFKRSLVAHNPDYKRAVETADKKLEDALVRFYSRGPDGRDSPSVEAARQRAESDHRRALDAALTDRRDRLRRDVPRLASVLSSSGTRCYQAPDQGIYGGPYRSSQRVVGAMRTYKANRERADARFGDCVGHAHMRSVGASANAALKASRERAEAARESARSVVITRVIGADRDQAERLRALEAAIPAGLRAAGQREALETIPGLPEA